MGEAAKFGYPHITKTPDVCSGRPCVDGTRVRVIDIVSAHEAGHTAVELQDYFSTRSLTLGEIYAYGFPFGHEGGSTGWRQWTTGNSAPLTLADGSLDFTGSERLPSGFNLSEQNFRFLALDDDDPAMHRPLKGDASPYCHLRGRLGRGEKRPQAHEV